MMIYLKTMQQNTNSIYVEVQYFPLKCIKYYNFYFIKVKIYQLVILINYIFDKKYILPKHRVEPYLS